jgi:uridine kinase
MGWTRTDSPYPGSTPTRTADALVLIEGLFLHRNELVHLWDMSIFLDVPFTETARRMAHRDGSSPDPDHDSMRRYVGGQRIYFEQAKPWRRATIIVDNTDFEHPKVIDAAEAHGGR